jgi:hypothetical protein
MYEMKDMRFYFLVGSEGNIKSIEPMENCDQDEGLQILHQIIDLQFIEIGLQSEGDITIQDGIVYLDYTILIENVRENVQESFSCTELDLE